MCASKYLQIRGLHGGIEHEGYEGHGGVAWIPRSGVSFVIFESFVFNPAFQTD